MIERVFVHKGSYSNFSGLLHSFSIVHTPFVSCHSPLHTYLSTKIIIVITFTPFIFCSITMPSLSSYDDHRLHCILSISDTASSSPLVSSLSHHHFTGHQVIFNLHHITTASSPLITSSQSILDCFSLSYMF